MNLLFILVTLHLFIALSSADVVSDAVLTASTEDLQKLPIQMLRNMLSRRGLECKGCTDKGDYVKMAFDTQHVAIQPAKALSEEGKEKDEARNSNEANDIMETLRKGGFGGVKMFTKEDLKDLSADELVQTFGAAGGGGEAAKKSRSSRNSEKSKRKSGGDGSKDVKDKKSRKANDKNGKFKKDMKKDDITSGKHKRKKTLLSINRSNPPKETSRPTAEEAGIRIEL